MCIFEYMYFQIGAFFDVWRLFFDVCAVLLSKSQMNKFNTLL